MQRIWRLALGLGLTAGIVAGCGDESPTEVGSDLLGEGLRTVRVVLDAPEFMVGDTTYDGFGSLNDVLFGMVADDFEGDMDAHLLFRIVRPFQVTYEDAAGTAQTDSLAAIRGGTLTVVVDSQSSAVGPISFEVLELTEEWDRGTVGWDLRVDTSAVAEPWTTPGGTTGSVLATATWQSGDTLLIPIDSAAAAVWHDTTAARRGGLLRVTTPGERLRIQSLSFAFDVVPENADTVLTAGQVSQFVSVASPDSAPGPDVLRVGGLPVWRSLLHFRPLAELPIPCESTPTSCTVPLSEVEVATANLLLRTRPAGGHRAERAMRLEGRAVLEGPGVPLVRSPLSRALGQMTETLDVEDFTGAGAGTEARIPVTGYIQRNVSPPDDEEPLLWLALVVAGERTNFGYGEFGSLSSAAAPRLELVVTIPVRKVEP